MRFIAGDAEAILADERAKESQPIPSKVRETILKSLTIAYAISRIPYEEIEAAIDWLDSLPQQEANHDKSTQ